MSTINGDSLVRDCSSRNAELTVLCTSYMVGAVDMLDAFESSTDISEVTCIPTEATGEQMAKVLIKYGHEHPENLHLQVPSS